MFAKHNRTRDAAPRVYLPKLPWRRIGTGAVVIVVFVACAWMPVRSLDKPIKHVQIEGKFQRISPVQVEQAIAGFAGAGFLSVRLRDVRQVVARVPWADTVLVERSWPDSLRVRVIEQVPAARWGDDGLLNTRGELFLIDTHHLPIDLPRLDGPPGTQSKVTQLYLATYPQLLAVGVNLTSVKLDARGAWELSVANGVQVRLGRHDVEGRLQRFIHDATPAVAQRLNEIAYVDMRYSNGFAVGWNASLPAKTSSKKDAAPNA